MRMTSSDVRQRGGADCAVCGVRVGLVFALGAAGLLAFGGPGRLAGAARDARLVAEYRLLALGRAPRDPLAQREVAADASDDCAVGPDLLQLLR